MRFAFVLLLGGFAAPAALACKCVSSLIPHTCPPLPHVDGEDSAVFLGKVVDTMPRSVKDFFELAERVNGKKFSFRLDENDRQLTPAQEQEFLEGMKQVALFLGRDILTPAQQEQIRQAKSVDDIEGPTENVSWPGRRVRLEVLERFTGPEVPVFELFTGMGGGDCGVEFQEGEVWVVSASRDKAGRWSTNICGPTLLAADDPQYLKALRAWKKGETLPPHVYGWVAKNDTRPGASSDPEAFPGAAIDLVGACGRFSATSDAEGRFSFDRLPVCSYSLSVRDARWRVGFLRPIDLTRANCAEVHVLLEPIGQKR